MRLVTTVCLVASALMAQDPVDTAGWINRGVQEFKAARFPQAAASFHRALVSDSRNITAQLYLAATYQTQFIPGVDTPENRAMASAAIFHYLSILDQDRANKLALASLGSLNIKQKDWAMAGMRYGSLVAADPGNALAWYSLGFIAWSEWKQAYGAARASAGLQPADPGPLPAGAAKVELQRYSFRVNSGLKSLRQALLVNPSNADAMAYMNLLIRERADLRDTFADYQRDIAEADQWAEKALETKRQQGAAGADAVPLPGGASIGVEQSIVASSVFVPPPPAGGSASGEPRRASEPGSIFPKLVQSVPPVYPATAQQPGIKGIVHMEAVIAKDGRIKELHVLGGQTWLAQAAIDAVKHWVYQPTLFQGAPVEVMIPIDVSFPPE